MPQRIAGWEQVWKEEDLSNASDLLWAYQLKHEL